ncbi:MAG: S41 family peptidase [Flavobacteriales bacterium]|jgi:carboxyl-terminal processing protease
MESNPKNYWLIPLGLAFAMAIGLGLGYFLVPHTDYTHGEQKGEKYQKIQDILEVLDKRYVDDVNGEKLFEETISDMLHKLDPHSNYIPAKDLKLAQEGIEGKFGGVGVRFNILRDTICITNVVKGSPSERAGLLAGDRIISVNGKKTASAKITNQKVMEYLKGKEGTKVKVEIQRGKDKKTFSVTRGGIPITSVTSAFMMNQSVGYIRIEQFSVPTHDEFRYAAESLLQQGMTKLILDLRYNPGGVLSAAIDISDEFLPGGMTIVETRGINQRDEKYKSRSGGLLERIETAVLINQNSASASEIVAGALQDNDRATIYGRRSFGKGLVQGDFNLRDGSNLRLTVARYYTPSGRCIQKEYNGSMEDYYADSRDRYDNGELFAPDSTLFGDSLKYRTRKGRIVYGGGGIMPDVFIPLDTLDYTGYFNQLRFSGAVQAFAFDFVNGKRKQWPSLKNFSTTFQVGNDLSRKFAKYAADDFAVPFSSQELSKSHNSISRTLKAEIARQIWLENGYFYITNQTDNEVQVVLKNMVKKGE